MISIKNKEAELVTFFWFVYSLIGSISVVLFSRQTEIKK